MAPPGAHEAKNLAFHVPGFERQADCLARKAPDIAAAQLRASKARRIAWSAMHGNMKSQEKSCTRKPPDLAPQAPSLRTMAAGDGWAPGRPGPGRARIARRPFAARDRAYAVLPDAVLRQRSGK